MPSTTKTKRRDADFYETPEWCTRALLDSYPIDSNSVIVEPCAGHGAISRVIKEYYPECTLVQYELNRNKKLEKISTVEFGDFLKQDGLISVGNSLKTDPRCSLVDYVITNPPFTYAQEFITNCRLIYPNAEIIMLLPFSFLGSDKRHGWWKQNTPNKQTVLSTRPSFTNDGKTDSSVYAWYHWFNEARKNIFLPMTFVRRGK